MSSAEQWAANQKFLDRMIARGDDVILATPLDKVKPGSIFERELQYLQSRDFTPSADGTRMIPGGGK
jgi:cell wall-associated NlpC family hydrolase